MTRSILAVVALACGLAGCIAEVGGPDRGLLIPVAVAQDDDGGQQEPAPANTIDRDTSTESFGVSGSVSQTGKYELFDLGPGAVGDNWLVEPQSQTASFTLVLLDDQYDLLMRTVASRGMQLSHTARHATAHVYLGVALASNSSGGTFDLQVKWQSGLVAPGRTRQIVYLDFDGASGVRVHGRSGVTFPPFDASSISPDYAGATEQVVAEIAQTMRLDYAFYDVTILSSLEGPPPQDTECTTIYFGGSDDTLLGLADNVDMYNSNKQQAAVVFIESFSPYSVMGLDAEEMALMIGNVGSHELGHLLGLYHTQDPSEIMDSTGSAWDLAQDQAFQRAPLEENVFPTGMQNAPELLQETLGSNSSAARGSAKSLSAAKIALRARMRRFTLSEISHRCGLCLNPDAVGGK
jgi:hypothetical protein